MNRIDLYLHDLYPPSLYDRKDSWNTAMSRGLPGEWQQMKATITGNHGQVRLVPSLIPRVSLFQLVGTWLVYYFHPGTQVPVEPNFVSLSLSSGDILWHPKTIQRSSQQYIMHISADRIKERRRILETKLAYFFHPGTQVLVESNLLLDFRVIISFFWRHLFGIQKRQNSTYSSETPWP